MLFRIIIYFILFYYLFRLIFRYLVPLFITRQVHKMQNKQEKAREDYINQRKKEEGKVTIEYNPRSSNTSGKNDQKGEYVDYEEIK